MFPSIKLWNILIPERDIGASLGVGVSLGFEVDVGGMVDTVADAASAAWDGISDDWDKFTSWW